MSLMPRDGSKNVTLWAGCNCESGSLQAIEYFNLHMHHWLKNTINWKMPHRDANYTKLTVRELKNGGGDFQNKPPEKAKYG